MARRPGQGKDEASGVMSEAGEPSKSEIRRRMREELARLSPAEREAGSCAIRDRLLRQPAWSSARCILLFAPLPGEPDVFPLLLRALEEGKTVALPAYLPACDGYVPKAVRRVPQDLVEGRFGVREPGKECPVVAPNQLDLVLVPGVAFTPGGWRVGRGKGYFDRLLTMVRGITCGVGFERQLLEQVPVEPHDIRLNCILTPSRWLVV